MTIKIILCKSNNVCHKSLNRLKGFLMDVIIGPFSFSISLENEMVVMTRPEINFNVLET